MPPADVVLRFAGVAVTGAPARDLTAHDIERLAYLRALRRAPDGPRPSPHRPPAEVEAMTSDLTARGRYFPATNRAR